METPTAPAESADRPNELKQALQPSEVRAAELLPSISLLSATLEATADGIVAIDPDGTLILHNTRFVSMWQVPPKMLERCDFADFLKHAAARIIGPEPVVQRLQSLLAKPEVATIESIALKDGHVFECHVLPQLLAGDYRGIVISWREITERKRVEQALIRSEEKYRLLWTTAEDAYVMCDGTSRILETNAAIETLFGYRPDEVIGRNLAMLQPERLRESHRRGLQRYLESGVRRINWRAVETFGLHRDGHEVPVEIAFNHFRQDGRDLFAGFIRSISERKRAETEREVLLKRAQSARRDAEIANRAKDEFLATLSHELRTPLTAIQGWALMIGDPRLSEAERANGVEAIKRNAKRQAQIVEDILDVSRIISGKLRLDVRPMELPAVIDAAIESMEPAARARQIQIVRHFDAPGALVSGDAGRLQQVMWNLLSNAIKFTPAYGRVEVHLRCVDAQLEIRVADSGEGIDSEFLPYIFDRFRQADSSDTRSHGGLGLGLAIVRHLVEMHGGRVQARSDGIGKGSVFVVTLPLLASPTPLLSAMSHLPGIAAPSTRGDISVERRAWPAQSTARDGDAAPLDLTGVHVLVVEDDEDTRIFINTVLKKANARVSTLTTATDALNELPRLRPDVFICDLGLPDEDGCELMRKVRALPAEQGGNTPAAALTAYARSEDRVRVLRCGFQMHVAKPVEPEELVAVISSLTQSRKAE